MGVLSNNNNKNSAGATSTGGTATTIINSGGVHNPQHLAPMTVSVGPGSTTTGQQGSPSQTVLITKQGPGIVASTTTNQLGGSNVGPATVGPAHLQQQQQPSTTITSNLAGNVQPNTSTQTTTQTIINAAGGLRVLNMNMNVNAVQAAAVGAASSTTVPAGAVAASPAQKVIAPRMILSPQMIGARPGQPGVSRP